MERVKWEDQDSPPPYNDQEPPGYSSGRRQPVCESYAMTVMKKRPNTTRAVSDFWAMRKNFRSIHSDSSSCLTSPRNDYGVCSDTERQSNFFSSATPLLAKQLDTVCESCAVTDTRSRMFPRRNESTWEVGRHHPREGLIFLSFSPNE